MQESRHNRRYEKQQTKEQRSTLRRGENTQAETGTALSISGRRKRNRRKNFDRSDGDQLELAAKIFAIPGARRGKAPDKSQEQRGIASASYKSTARCSLEGKQQERRNRESSIY